MLGRTAVGMDSLGGSADAARLSDANSSVAANRITLGGSGGAVAVSLTVPQLPSHAHANTLNETPHAHAGQPGTGYSRRSAGLRFRRALRTAAATTGITINNASIGRGSTHDNMPPCLLCGMIVKEH